MIRLPLGVAFAAVLLSACAAQPGTETARRDDDAYVPIGSNIPRKDRKPEASAQLPPGPRISGPTAPRN